MLHSLLPKAHAKTLALPLLGSIADGFDDWLAANGYRCGSRKNAIRMVRKRTAMLSITHKSVVCPRVRCEGMCCFSCRMRPRCQNNDG